MANSVDFRVKNGLLVASTATFQSTVNATSTVTGALQVAGGVGIGRDLYVGGTIYGNGVISTATNIAGGTAGSIVYQSATGATGFINTGTPGSILQMGTGSTATFVSSSSVYVGFANLAATATSAATAYALADTSTTYVGFANIANQINTLAQTANTTYYPTFVDSNNATAAAESVYTTSSFTINAASGGIRIAGVTTVTNTTNASSTTTGALTVAGGVGIGANAFIGGTATVLSTLASTTTLSANALYIAGGVGIAKSLLVTGEAIFQNNVIFSGTSTYVYSTNTVYTDNIINVHVPVGSTGSNHTWTVDDGKDIGFVFHNYKGADNDSFLGWANATGYLEWYGTGLETGSGTFTNAVYGTFKTGAIVLTSSTQATSTNTGALTVAGGVGIGGNLYLGGTLFGTVSGNITTATNIAGGTNGAIVYQVSPGVTGFINTGTSGSILQMGNATTATFVSSSSVYVGFANLAANATTATSAATAYALANTSTTYVGFANRAVFANTATNLAGGLAGYIPIQTDAGATSFIVAGSAGQILLSSGSTATWASLGTITAGNATTATNIAGGTLGQIHYQTAPGVTGFISTGTAGSILQMGTATTATFVSSSSVYVGFANLAASATTATSAATAYALANTSTTYVGFANSANQINTLAQTANATYFATFVDSNNPTATGESVYTTSSFAINPSTGQVAIGSSFLSTSSKLTVNGRIESLIDPASEGGQVVLRGKNFYRWSIDNYQDTFRIIKEDDVTETNGSTALTITSGTSAVMIGASTQYSGEKLGINGGVYVNGILTATAIYGTFNGTIGTASVNTSSQVNTVIRSTNATHYLTFVDSNNTVSEGELIYTTGTVYVNPSTGRLTAVSVNVSQNGTGQGLLVGDDLWIGDINLSNTTQLSGAQDSTQAYLVFGSSDTTSLGRSGTGPLTYGGNFRVSGITTVTNTTNASSTITGALQVIGGAGIGGNLYVGGTIFGLTSISGTVTTATNIAGGSLGQIPYQTAAGLTSFIGTGTNGSLLRMGANTATFISTSNIYVGSALTANNITGGAAGSIVYQSVAGTTQFIGIGSNGSILQSNGSTATFVSLGAISSGRATTATNLDSGAFGQIPYQTAAGLTSFIGTGTNGSLLQMGANTATFVTTGSIHVANANFAVNSTNATNATNATNISGGVAGSVVYQSASGTTQFIGIGGNGSILQSNGTTATFVALGAISSGRATTATNIDSGAFGQIPYQTAAGLTSFIGTGTNGSLLRMGANTATFVTTGSVHVGAADFAVGASTASQVNTIAQTANATYFLTFVDANNATATSEPVYTTSSFTINAASGGVRISGITTVTNTTAASSTATGALQVIGGVGIGGNLYVGGTIFGLASVSGTISTATSLAGGSLGQIPYQTAAGVTGFISTGTAGSILQMGAATTATFVTTGSIHVGTANFAVTATNAATAYSLANTSTTYVGRAVFADNAGTATQVATVAQTTNATYFLTFVDANNATPLVETIHTTSSFTVNAASGGVRIGGVTTVTNTTNASSTVTGALQVAGGMGVGRDLWVGAGVYAATKSFLIDHPSKPGWKLVHGSLEGPENGVYVRGKITGSNKIHLPDFWINLVDFDSITVNLTPIGKYQQLFVENVEGLEITIANAQDSDMNFFYTVWAERIDVDKLRVEVN